MKPASVKGLPQSFTGPLPTLHTARMMFHGAGDAESTSEIYQGAQVHAARTKELGLACQSLVPQRALHMDDQMNRERRAGMHAPATHIVIRPRLAWPAL
jgi:hypothetical protein